MPPSNKGRQIKIHKAQIPSNMSDKAISLINDALDKFQIEKVIRLLSLSMFLSNNLIFCFKNFRIWPRLLKRSAMKNSVAHGIVLSVEISVALSLMTLNLSYFFK